jgi:hypothetical protein
MAKKDNTLLIVAGLAALGGAYWYMKKEEKAKASSSSSPFDGVAGYAQLDPAMKAQLDMLLKTGTPEQLTTAANNLDAASGGPNPVSAVLRQVAAQKAANTLPPGTY